MPQAQRLLLAGVGGPAGRGQPAIDGLELGRLAALLEGALELVGAVEMVLDGRLAAAGDEDELLDAGCLRLFDGVLDQRLVDDRQHLLGHRLGGGEKAGAQAADGKDRLANASCAHRAHVG
jgi:hypothetical protein